MRLTTSLTVGSLVLAAAAQAQVPWQAETSPLQVTAGPVVVARSSADGGATVVVTASPLGSNLSVFALDGGLAQIVPTGILHGVAAISGLKSPTAPRDLVVATGYVLGQLFVFGVSDQGAMTTAVQGNVFTTVGPGIVALSVAPDGGLEALWEGGTGDLPRITLLDDGLGHYTYVNAPHVILPAAPSAMAISERRLFAVIPQLGIVATELDDPSGTVSVLEAVDGGVLGGLPSGLAVYPLEPGRVVLLVSVPLTNEFVAYDVRKTSITPVTRFRLAQDGGTPAVTGSEQLAVSAAPIAGFPRGLLVVQDPNANAGANYKLVGLAQLAAQTSPPCSYRQGPGRPPTPASRSPTGAFATPA